MSWYDRLKSQPSTSTSDRDTKRKELESGRLLRAKKREDRKKELQALLESRQSSEEAIKDLLDIDLEVFAGEDLTEEEINTLLDSSTDSSSCSSTELIIKKLMVWRPFGRPCGRKFCDSKNRGL